MNVLATPQVGQEPRRDADVHPIPAPGADARKRPGKADPQAAGRDLSPSGQEWGWACRMLEAGWDPQKVYEALVEKAASRRGADAERYAMRTVERATEKARRRLR